MSFHHAQPHRNGPSGNFEPLGDFSQYTDSDSHEFPATNTDDQRTSVSESIPDISDDDARFELLSAYLDDEVTAEERQLVAQWLRDESEIQQMYQQLLMLRQAIRMAPVPEQPPLQMPSPPTIWQQSSLGVMRWTLVCATAIALLGGLSQLGTTHGRQQLKEAWQFIKALPQETLLETGLNR